MPTEIAKWVTDIGAEMRLRVQIAALDTSAQHIDELLKIIAEREIALNKAKGISPR